VSDKAPVSPPASSPLVDLSNPAFYINRELSLLEFHRRVLEEAQDPANPLLERVKFLSIVGSNLDELFMVRVAGLKAQVAAGVMEASLDGLSPAEQLAVVRKAGLKLMQDARACLRADLMPRLREAGIHFLGYADLTDRQRERIDGYFHEIFPALTPLAFDPGRPFPHISNLSLNLAVIIRDAEGDHFFARVKVPGSLPRFVPVKRSSGGVRRDGTAPHSHYFVLLEELIAAHLDLLFPGMTIVESHPFRVTRDAESDIREMEASDLLETIEREVRQRQFGSVVRLVITSTMPANVRELLKKELEVDDNDVYVLDPPLGLAGLMNLYSNVDRRDLKYPHFVPATPPALAGAREPGRIFEAIRQGDILLHHPYDAFTPVVDFLRAAASDPDVLAIKQTLYRVGLNSPVVDALLHARENGKQVSVLVELKARFDEKSNIGWARRLEKEGVHVVYGLLGLKTHSKIVLVVRREGDKIRRYVHLATGNYNPVTANLYTDIGMFTCDPAIAADVTDVFNYLTGYSAKRDYGKLLVAPINLREGMVRLIRREIEHQRRGRGGHVIFKMNALVDPGMIRVLYEAAQAGVRVDLVVRGICDLRPGVPGVSDSIRVISVVGRFLEHSRVFFFRNAGDPEVYLGSADLMPRNIDRRVEVVFPVGRPELVGYLRDEVLATYLADNVKARELRQDGRYVRVAVLPGEPRIDSQERLLAVHTAMRRDAGDLRLPR